MKRIDLIKLEHSTKIGHPCGSIKPNVTEDCIFYVDGISIGFYMRIMPLKMQKLANLADKELRSKNVPKSVMKRKTHDGKDENGKYKYKNEVDQYSTILGGTPPKPHMGRNYANLSSVHLVKTAQTFIKSMLMLANEAEQLIKEILPEQHAKQKKLFEQVNDKWKFGNLWTSSISNYNIAAPFHRDTGNVVGAVNVIITKRKNAVGGNLNVPDYGATIDSCDNSILVYPAWQNVHGVTPIIPTAPNGYRNSLIFYPLKAFIGLD